MAKFFKTLHKNLLPFCLAGTLLAGTSCADFYAEKPKIKARSLAVLVIDMQDPFLKEVDEKELKAELPYQAEVLNYCKGNNIPVFVIEYKDCGQTTGYLKEKIDSLPKKIYVTKSSRDAFEGTDLEKKLKETKAETVILMGVYASACVQDTAEGALKSGFKIATSKDLIADCKWSKEDVKWYKKKGVYKDDYKELLSLIEK